MTDRFRGVRAMYHDGMMIAVDAGRGALNSQVEHCGAAPEPFDVVRALPRYFA